MGRPLQILFILLILVSGPALAALASVEADYMLGAQILFALPLAFFLSTLFSFSLAYFGATKEWETLWVCCALLVGLSVFLFSGSIILGITLLTAKIASLLGVDGATGMFVSIIAFILAPFALINIALVITIILVPKTKNVISTLFAIILSVYISCLAIRLGDDFLVVGFSEIRDILLTEVREYHSDISFQEALSASAFYLIGLIPLAILALYRIKTTLSIRQGIILLLVSILPIYSFVAAIEIFKGERRALIWPVRVASDYLPKSERDAHVKRLTTISKDRPLRIGRNWYGFADLEATGVKPAPVMRPQTNVFARLVVAPDDLDLPSAVGDDSGDFAFSISEGRLGKPANFDPERSQPHIWIGDLLVWFSRSSYDDGWPQNAVILERIRDYIESARVDPSIETSASSPAPGN